MNKYLLHDLEIGKCPICGAKLEKIEFISNCQVVIRSKVRGGNWDAIDEPEIHFSEDNPIIEYKCDICEITFHAARDLYYGDQ